MDRLTEREGSRCAGCQDAGECAYTDGSFPVPCPDAARYERLKDYENLEERGQLLKLPCPMGSTVYMIVRKRPKIGQPEFSFVKTTYLTENNLLRIVRDFGKTVFSTHEEAERVREANSNG